MGEVKRYVMAVQMAPGAFNYEVHAFLGESEKPLIDPREEFVLASDYDTALARNAELRAALERAERKLSAYVGFCDGDKELTGTVLPMARKALSSTR